jgi:catechol 2,3-dioxygenase-like lactoylglutathione lyase family enzyme
MPIIGLDHVQLAMPAGGEDLARGFYRDVLGLAEQPKPPHLAKRGGCWFESDLVKIHLGVDQEFRAATKAHPGLLVQGLPAIVEACRAGGFQVVNDEPLEGYDRIYVNDPFGNRLELMERNYPTLPGQS